MVAFSGTSSFFLVSLISGVLAMGEDPTTSKPNILLSGVAFLYYGTVGIALFAICAMFAVCMFLDHKRSSNDEQLEKKYALNDQAKTRLCEAEVKMENLIQEEAQLIEYIHQIDLRMKQDRRLYLREADRKGDEADEAKRKVGNLANTNRIADADEATILRKRLDIEREAMADSIRKKMKQNERARQSQMRQAVDEAHRSSAVLPKPVLGLSSILRRRQKSTESGAQSRVPSSYLKHSSSGLRRQAANENNMDYQMME
ncbi:hypothetical protein M3Y98_01011900 [Aphelenchoides besseyi]|nr:hypothetical protein M3Y98_01011900 [Aphelenchoides besseyi]KAI6210156.1 hypothetical protein M3Y96_00297900 [Aphelenchoides besseyi]